MKSLIEQFSNTNILITTNNWFMAPDGMMYNAVWGKVEIYSDAETLGIKTNEKSTNWYAIVGTGGKRVIVAGCQIHYACACMEKPNTEPTIGNWASMEQAKVFQGEIRGTIYLAQ